LSNPPPSDVQEQTYWVDVVQLASDHLLRAAQRFVIAQEQPSLYDIDYLENGVCRALEAIVVSALSPSVIFEQLRQWTAMGESLDTIQSLFPTLSIMSCVRLTLERIGERLSLLRHAFFQPGLPTTQQPTIVQKMDIVLSALRFMKEQRLYVLNINYDNRWINPWVEYHSVNPSRSALTACDPLQLPRLRYHIMRIRLIQRAINGF